MSKKIIFGIIAVVVLAIAGFFVYTSYFSEKGISLAPSISLKVNLLSGEEEIKEIFVENFKNYEQQVQVTLIGFDNIASLSENNFNLTPGETKKINVSFNTKLNEAGIYVGKFIAKSKEFTKELPILVSVKDENRIFTINQDINSEYDNVRAGGLLGVDLDIFDMDGNNLREVQIQNSIMDFDGNVLLDNEEDFTVNGSSKKTIILEIPEDWKEGYYVLITTAEYKGVKSVSGYIFKLGNLNENFLEGNFQLFIVLVCIFIIVILVLFFYFVKTRDDLIVELRKQQNVELRKNVEVFNQSKKKLIGIKDNVRKKKELNKLTEIKKKVLGNIKRKQKEQRKEIKRLKKRKKKSEAERKISQWKKKGYKMLDAEKQVKKISENFKDEMQKLKKQGYKI